MRAQNRFDTIDRYTLMRTKGRSMLPTIEEGDLLVIDRHVARVHAGDIVLFGDVAHRVVWVDPLRGVWQCGDNAQACAVRHSPGDVHGRVVAVIRDEGFVELRPSSISRPRLLVRTLLWHAKSRIRRRLLG